MCSKTVRTAEHVSANTSARNATSSTTISVPSSVFSGFVVAFPGISGVEEPISLRWVRHMQDWWRREFLSLWQMCPNEKSMFCLWVCSITGCCYTTTLKDSHRCVDGAMHHNCPVCMEYLFDSMKAISVLHCGHTIHLECLYEMRAHQQFSCPVCLRSACNMSDIWQKLDQQVAASPMPAIYQKKMVWILCNDCGVTSNVQFHILAHKCPGCSSYNTRQTRGDPAACSRV
ncbi:E3 ubiquitin-protein ligase RZFP34 isoform X7 [Zea mays]|uniref:E3 ubiquitin-protein ligase RZFP34 isoform X7 n=1 Tax=Zea mays TaxID=4577 RepID=UPI0009A9FB2B|nr:uncharacterized protein LOC100192089 isoform X7 [Zea mays]XP_020407740.1 uncharacterized protein LOC100192089 isoform X7 [Zea mays]|eukprot:XP_020407717.1 uncharacterized protein LOC100192089 isoform X5 [Zea mays]